MISIDIEGDLKHVMAVGIVVGMVIGGLIGMAIPDSGVTFTDEIVQKNGVADSNELCATIYGAEHGYGSGITQLNCYDNGTRHSLGARDLSKALNSSYTIGEN